MHSFSDIEIVPATSNSADLPSAKHRFSGSEASLEDLYDDYHQQALWLAHRILQDANDAEDVVQEVYLSAWRSARTYDGTKGSTKTWLLTMVRNRSIDAIRSRKRRPVCLVQNDAELNDIEDPTATPDARVDSQIAIEAVAALPTRQRQVVEMIYLQGLSHGDVAAQLQTPVGTIKSRMRLALQRLRAMLGDVSPQPTFV